MKKWFYTLLGRFIQRLATNIAVELAKQQETQIKTINIAHKVDNMTARERAVLALKYGFNWREEFMKGQAQ